MVVFGSFDDGVAQLDMPRGFSSLVPFFHVGVSGFYSTAHMFNDFVHIPSS